MIEPQEQEPYGEEEGYVIIYRNKELGYNIWADFYNDFDELVEFRLLISNNESLALQELQSYPPKWGKPLKLTASECRDLCFDEDDDFYRFLEKI